MHRKFDTMQKVHIISVDEPLMLNLALAIREKGYEVSVSGEHLDNDIISQLNIAKCQHLESGWHPELITKDIRFVVLGANVLTNNPELERARELGLLVLSLPEFIYQRMKGKTRVVISGSKGKRAIISMIAYTLQKQKMDFDYAITSQVPVLPNRIRMSYEARIALIEGDEHVTSALEKRFQLEFYRPHLAVLAHLVWSAGNDHESPESYLNTYQLFSTSIEREGKLIYYGMDPALNQLAQDVRPDITAIPYTEHSFITKEDGKTYLDTRYGDYEVRIPDKYFLINLNAARLTCRQLGIKDADFYQAISEYSLSL